MEDVMNRSPLSVVAVSNDALRPELLDRLLVDDNDCDVIVIESIAGGYSRIRELQPHVVVLFMEIDDVDGCQLLSMLHTDRALRGTSVVTCTTGPHCPERPMLPFFEERAQTVAAAAS
jgi:DNA-binding NarL/FixJ family response regulator